MQSELAYYNGQWDMQCYLLSVIYRCSSAEIDSLCTKGLSGSETPFLNNLLWLSELIVGDPLSRTLLY